MKIDRLALIKRNNPALTTIDCHSPLTVGNGEFAFTADITGMQTLYEAYEDAGMPLCTMAQKIWHSTPGSDGSYYTREDLVETSFDFCGRTVHYPVQAAPGNEEVYYWLRQNPHRPNLIRIGLVRVTGEVYEPVHESGESYKQKHVSSCSYEQIEPEEITDVKQVLHMETGVLESHFCLSGVPFEVRTAWAGERDSLAFSVNVPDEGRREMPYAVLLAFPYGSSGKSGADWESPERHQTIQRGNCFHRILDRDTYEVRITETASERLIRCSEHTYLLMPDAQETFTFGISFHSSEEMPDYDAAEQLSAAFWSRFWNTTGVVDLHESKDSRSAELERRIVLSQYLLRINSSGSFPPQETGLTCNSWHGKFHMEMYFWHEAYLALYGLQEILEKSMDWCLLHLEDAIAEAKSNGFRGARWPKQTAYDAVNSPSPISPLLLWQQPHLIYMLAMCQHNGLDRSRLRKYYPLVKESADFMADYARSGENAEGMYELRPPLIPVQECHPPLETANPVFETEYWVKALELAAELAEEVGEEPPAQWRETAERMVPSPFDERYYLAASGCNETFSKYNTDHPSMLMAYGVIDSGRMDPEKVRNTLQKVRDVWNMQSLWGWDFAVMAMTAVRLRMPDLAIDLLLADTEKNTYIANGHNRQEGSEALPLYLPGNGSLLLAIACMTAGFEGCEEDCPGFPKDGRWTVSYEGIAPLL